LGNPLHGLPLLEDLPDLNGKRVLVRVDFNVPLHIGIDGRATVADDFRILAALPTLRWLQDQGADVVACSHLGRPPNAPDPRWEMDPVRDRLEMLCPGIELAENLRFDPGEKKNDPAFVASLIEGFDAYVNEAFGVSHRSHASIVGPPQFLPSAAGIRLAKEVEVLGCLLERPARPFVAVVGGAKVADKLEVLKVLATKVDTLAVGGGMAFTFMAAEGQGVGSSLLDEEHIDDCRALLDSGTAILLPTDVRALEPGGTFGPPGAGIGPRGGVKVVEDDLTDGWTGLDIGPDTAAAFAGVVQQAGTVLWNGPLGAFEDKRFAGGTRVVAQAVAESPAFTVVGGGDSASALDMLGLSDQVDFLSTGGGASLTFIERGGDLPALEALRRAPNAPR
jgi:phosphoglycerate kinase